MRKEQGGCGGKAVMLCLVETPGQGQFISDYTINTGFVSHRAIFIICTNFTRNTAANPRKPTTTNKPSTP